MGPIMKRFIPSFGAALLYAVSPASAADFEGEWQMTDVPAASARLSIGPGSLSWSDGCNTFSKGYARSGEAFTFMPTMGTQMICEPKPRDYVGEAVEKIHILRRDGEDVVIVDASDSVVGRFKPAK
jgi:hypothetical protein